MTEALKPRSHAIIATFALDGPEKSSGMPIVRYDAAGLRAELAEEFALMQTRAQAHVTPWTSRQKFQFSILRRS